MADIVQKACQAILLDFIIRHARWVSSLNRFQRTSGDVADPPVNG